MIVFVVVFLTSCFPSDAQIQKAIMETLTAAPTSTLVPTQTLIPTQTPTAMALPTRTSTPRPSRTPTPRPTATPSIGTLKNPYPFGSAASLIQTSRGEKIEFTFQVKSIMRGQEAWSAIRAANRFNDPPPNGMEPIMVELYVRNDSSNGILNINKFDLYIVTKGRFIDAFDYSPCCLQDEGYMEFDIKLAGGGEATGWFVSMVNIDDNSPKLVIGADSSGRGGIYFSLVSP